MEYIINLIQNSLIPSSLNVVISKFPDGQQNVSIDNIPMNLSANDSVIIRSRLNSWKDLELIVATNAAIRKFTKKVTLYIPYLLGARSDRQFSKYGNSYLVDVLAPHINLCEFQQVTVVDVHSDVAAACIKNLDIISNNFFVQEAIEDIFRKPISDLQDEIVFVAPDAGAAKKVYKLAKEIGFKGDIVVCSKYRDEEGELSNLSINLDILSNLHKMFIIIDDICDGGRTFINISEYLKKEYGIGLFNKVLFVTHGIFSQGFDQLLQEFSTIATTNSYQDFPEMEESPKFTLINVI